MRRRTTFTITCGVRRAVTMTGTTPMSTKLSGRSFKSALGRQAQTIVFLQSTLTVASVESMNAWRTCGWSDCECSVHTMLPGQNTRIESSRTFVNSLSKRMAFKTMSSSSVLLERTNSRYSPRKCMSMRRTGSCVEFGFVKLHPDFWKWFQATM
jgi:hypothetical protein